MFRHFVPSRGLHSLATLMRSIPCGLAVRKQHEMLFAASKFEKLNTENLTVDWSQCAKS